MQGNKRLQIKPKLKYWVCSDLCEDNNKRNDEVCVHACGVCDVFNPVQVLDGRFGEGNAEVMVFAQIMIVELDQ